MGSNKALGFSFTVHVYFQTNAIAASSVYSMYRVTSSKLKMLQYRNEYMGTDENFYK